jgi:hypothetical protein
VPNGVTLPTGGRGQRVSLNVVRTPAARRTLASATVDSRTCRRLACGSAAQQPALAGCCRFGVVHRVQRHMPWAHREAVTTVCGDLAAGQGCSPGWWSRTALASVWACTTGFAHWGMDGFHHGMKHREFPVRGAGISTDWRGSLLRYGWHCAP